MAMNPLRSSCFAISIVSRDGFLRADPDFCGSREMFNLDQHRLAGFDGGECAGQAQRSTDWMS